MSDPRTGRGTFAPGAISVSNDPCHSIKIEGGRFLGGAEGSEPETPQVERITNTLGVCADCFDAALKRLAARIDRLDGGMPPQTADGAEKPSRCGQLGILEDQAEGLFERILVLNHQIARLERL